MIEDHDCAWLYWCRGLTLERWWEECRLVEERFSLFQSFAEPPFFGFRGPQLWLKVGDWPSKRKDPGTWGHCKRVAAFATVLAHALKLDDEEVRAIACGALLHEVGKLEIPDAILRKPGALTAEERLVMRGYCLRGYEIVRSHREQFDGTGYPRGLEGEAIPLGARIVGGRRCVRDARQRSPPPRGARIRDSRAEIQRWSGRHFDPRIVDVSMNQPDDDWKRACSRL